jgi:hypothetical protein
VDTVDEISKLAATLDKIQTVAALDIGTTLTDAQKFSVDELKNLGLTGFTGTDAQNTALALKVSESIRDKNPADVVAGDFPNGKLDTTTSKPIKWSQTQLERLQTLVSLEIIKNHVVDTTTPANTTIVPTLTDWQNIGVFKPSTLKDTPDNSAADGYTAFKSMAVPSTMPVEGQKPVRAAAAAVAAMREAVGPDIDIMVDCHARPSPAMGLKFGKALDEFGFEKTETHLNEGRYAPSWEGLYPKSPEMFETVPEWFRQGTCGRGGAFASSLLMRLQDEPLDMANFYTADTSVWSMFGTFGIRTPVYHAFRAFNELAKRPRRVACTVAGATAATDGAAKPRSAADNEINPGGDTAKRPTKPPVAVAGIAEDGGSAVVLVSTFDAAAGPRTISIAGLPWAATARVEPLLVDDDHALEPVAIGRAGNGPAATGSSRSRGCSRSRRRPRWAAPSCSACCPPRGPSCQSQRRRSTKTTTPRAS